MTRESLEKIKAIVAKRHQELENSKNPRTLARKRLEESGLILRNGQSNPIFDSTPHEKMAVPSNMEFFAGARLIPSSVRPITGPVLFSAVGQVLFPPDPNLGYVSAYVEKAPELGWVTAPKTGTNVPEKEK